MNIFKGPFAPKMPYWLKKRKDLLHILKQLNNMLLNFFRMSDRSSTPDNSTCEGTYKQLKCLNRRDWPDGKG